jgi:hypothetical protein
MRPKIDWAAPIDEICPFNMVQSSSPGVDRKSAFSIMRKSLEPNTKSDDRANVLVDDYGVSCHTKLQGFQ